MFATIGAALQAAGYTVTPCRAKAPILPAWQKGGTISPEQFNQHHARNVGLVLGVAPWYVVALDIDSADEAYAERCEALALELLGCAPVRVGAWPKRLLLYRLSGPHAKLKRGNLEVLCTGQQCVVYGTHPDTGREYEWTDLLGGFREWAPGELTLVEWSAVEAWMAACEAEREEPGEPGSKGTGGLNENRAPDTRGETGDPMTDYAPPLGLSIDEARALLAYAGDPAVLDYDEWLRVGMALHHEGGGADEWKALWDEWCGDSPKFVQETGDYKWESFGRRSGRPVTLKWLIALRGEAQRAKGGGGYARTEAGNAQRLVDAFGRDLMFCPETGQFYHFNGGWWDKVSLTYPQQLAKSIVDGMRADVDACDSDKEKADLLKWCAASQRWSMYEHMVKIATLEPSLWVRASEIDAQARYLGVRNGVVDLMTGALLPPDRAHRITRVAAVDYDAAAQCPLFEETLFDVMQGDMEMVRFFQRLIGYSVSGDPVEDILVIPYGGGGNGKSTLLNSIVHPLGAHALSAHSSSFVRDPANPGNAGLARPDLLDLIGARLVLVSEPPKDAELREDVIKAMAGGDKIPARALYSGTIVQIQPTWTAWMSTNHKPLIRGDDLGIWRRLCTLKCERSFENDPAKDPQRQARLRAEARGILAWIVRGHLDYLHQKGLVFPPPVQAARREYRSDMDLLADWLRERCVLEPTQKCSLSGLWGDWEAWARARGELRFVSSAKALSKRLQDRGFAKEYAKKGAVFCGLNLQITSLSDVE